MHEARRFEEIPDVELALASMSEGSFALPTLRPELPLWLYGDGCLGRMARECLRSVGREVAGAFDRSNLDGAPLEAQVAVCVVADQYAPIERALAHVGHGDVAPFYDLWEGARGVHPLANGWVAGPLTSEDQKGVLRVWKLLDDDSRAHYLQFLAWRCLREEWVFEGHAPVRNDDRYFIPEVASMLHDCETFLDGGAYDGRVSEKFISLVGDYDRIVAVEPDKVNRQLMLQALFTDHKVTVPYCALDSDDSYEKFCDGFGFASKLSLKGQRSVKTMKIDSLDVDPTFLKLHIEGNELYALRGGEETLRRCRPIVAATVYHDRDGLWRTMDWMMSALEDYRFLFRNHCWCGAGAVAYAVPRERGQS